MTQMTSGKVLRETRERKGYDLTTVARRLRIRPDILRAIEACDYASMPPRGYTRNMVNAYARLLGLNPTEIVNMYLDEIYAFQVEQARGRAPSSGFNMERESRLKRSRSSGRRDEQGSYSERLSNMSDSDAGSRSNGRYGRALYDDRTKYSRDDYGITRERMERPGKSDRDFLSHHSGYQSTNLGFLESEGRGTGRAVHVGETPMHYTASRLPSFLQSRAIIGVIAAVIIVVIAIVVFVMVNNGKATEQDDVSQLPVSGIKDTTGEEDDSGTSKVEVAPSSSRVVITVNKGDECYLETYADNVTTPYSLTGPAQETIEVTGVLKIATWTPEYATITVDSNPVELKEDDSLNGMYSYTVDFPANLENWRKTHTSREAQRSAALASAENGSQQQSNASPPSQESTENTDGTDGQEGESSEGSVQ